MDKKPGSARLGAEIPDLPMPVLKHQLSHAERRPFAGVQEKPDQEAPEGRQTERLGD
jgi:hypothetical protein